MEQILENIHKALDADKYINTQLVGHLPYIWEFAEVRYKGVTSRAAEMGLFDEVITGLIHVEEGLSFQKLGSLIGFTVKDNLAKMQKADSAEIEMLENALNDLNNKGLISGDVSGYYLKEKGETLAQDGWMPENVPIEFSIFLDGFDYSHIEKTGQLFKKWSLRNTVTHLDLLAQRLEKLGLEISIDGKIVHLDRKLEYQQEYDLGLQFLSTDAITGEYIYQAENSPYSYREFASELTENMDHFKEYVYEHDKKAHCPEERCKLLSDPIPDMVDVIEHGFEVQICLLTDPSQEVVQVKVFDPVTGRFSDYLSETLKEQGDFVKSILQDWINENPDLADKLETELTEREIEVKEKLKEIQTESLNKLEQAKTEEEFEEVIEMINSGRKAFDEYSFEEQLDWLFNTVEKELWLNFPRLRNQPLKTRLEQMEEALKRGVNIFLAYSKDYFNVDSMHDEQALNAYKNLDKKYANFFICEVDLSHKRTILAKSSEELAFEYIPSYNIMSFAPYGIEEEIAKEINYRVPWDDESTKEYEYLKSKFLAHYREQFNDFLDSFSWKHDHTINARANYEKIQKELQNAAHWATVFNEDQKEIEKRVNKLLSTKVHDIVKTELDTLERQLTDKTMTSKDGKLPPKEAVGRIFSLEAWSKKPEIDFPLDALHRCKVIRAGYYDTYPELKSKKGSNNNKGGGKKHHNKKNRRK